MSGILAGAMNYTIELPTGLIAIGGERPRVEVTGPPPPTLLLQTALVDLGAKTTEGQIVQAVTVPWLGIAQEITRNPDFLFEFPQYPRKFEEFIAGAYEKDGWEVELTPSSGDRGVDVIATKRGHMRVRVLDQCKARGGPHSLDSLAAFVSPT